MLRWSALDLARASKVGVATIRRVEVIDAAAFESNWIPKGRDTVLEQLILQRLKKCM